MVTEAKKGWCEYFFFFFFPTCLSSFLARPQPAGWKGKLRSGQCTPLAIVPLVPFTPSPNLSEMSLTKAGATSNPHWKTLGTRPCQGSRLRVPICGFSLNFSKQEAWKSASHWPEGEKGSSQVTQRSRHLLRSLRDLGSSKAHRSLFKVREAIISCRGEEQLFRAAC